MKKKINEGRKSNAQHTFEDNYGKDMKKVCEKCQMPQDECICEVIKEALKEVLTEAPYSQIKGLVGREAAIKYRKLSTGEVKTYFGRLTKISGENVYVGVLGKGLRAFRISNILDIRPVQATEEQIAELDEMCGGKPVLKKKYQGKQEETSFEPGSVSKKTGKVRDLAGNLVKPSKVCGHCKTPISSPNAKYCKKCGVYFDAVKPQQNEDDRYENIAAQKDAAWVKGYIRGYRDCKAGIRPAIPFQVEETAPPGWSGTTKAMSKHKEIDNPYALSWYMKKKGAKPHYKPVKK